ncbi:MAG: NAD-dependent epimerase/dehydratase family protein [Chitinivibrionales bacterium]|nr:NAD-dependent epimerase/dehydratase family protein [Chitinivibrionales bacterium]
MNILITGGAGFIGYNAAEHFARAGRHVHLIDNYCRTGSLENARDLKKRFPKILTSSKVDVRHPAQIRRVIASRKWDAIIHLAGQVAVTTSTRNPRQDFETNALGTLNILEGMRICASQALLIFASTNKVYGNLERVKVKKGTRAYFFPQFARGIPESVGLDFHSPYGCSKGAADQYIIDYSRIYGLNTVVFRQSCIYGKHQFGIEDQGWVAWFTIAALYNQPITIFGDGLQARDVLCATDLARLYQLAIEHKDCVNGKAYNIGGGPANVLSLVQLLEILEKKLDRSITTRCADWRPGDQRVYVSDLAAITRDLGWKPDINYHQGISMLADWALEQEQQLRKLGLIR